MTEIKFKVEYHREGSFYTVRGKRLKELKSLKAMRDKIMSISNAEWRWHVVLTFNDESLDFWFKLYKNVGKALSNYFDKIRKKFIGVKYFWKYEEGGKVWCYICKKKVDFIYDKEQYGWVYCKECENRFKSKGERPHYHVLFDFVNRTIRSRKDKIDVNLKKIKYKNVKKTLLKKDIYLLEWKAKRYDILDLIKLVFPQNWDKVNRKKWFKNQYSYDYNKNRTKLEILWGYYHYLKWGYVTGSGKWNKKGKFLANGIVYAREIKSYMDLKQYVVKDFFKYSESKWLKDSSTRKWTHSQNLLFTKDSKPTEEWEQLLETIGYYNMEGTLQLVKSSKDNLIAYYDGKNLVGKYVYKRIIEDIMDRGKMSADFVKPITVQKQLDVVFVGTVKCRYCEKEFDIDTGFVGLYCSRNCFNLFSKSIKFKMDKKRDWWNKKNGKEKK